MDLLNKDAILAADDMVTEVVEVPEWGGKVMIRTMAGKERDAWEARFVSMDGSPVGYVYGLRAALVALTVVGQDGKRLFTEKDIDALGKKSAKALSRVFMAAQKLNGLTIENVEELEKN